MKQILVGWAGATIAVHDPLNVVKRFFQQRRRYGSSVICYDRIAIRTPNVFRR